MTSIKGRVEYGTFSTLATGATVLCCLLLTGCSGSEYDGTNHYQDLPDGLAWTADPSWSPSGDAAIGVTVSSILDDQWGSPDNNGPEQLLSDDKSPWTSRHSSTRDQWIILDLGRPKVVFGIRTKGYDHNPSSHYQSGKSPKDMELQSGATISGPWETMSSFQGSEGNAQWTTSPLLEPHLAQYWRLRIANNWGAHDYIAMQGLELLLEVEASDTLRYIFVAAGALAGLCLFAVAYRRCGRYCRSRASQTAKLQEDEDQGAAGKQAPGGPSVWEHEDAQGGAGVEALEDGANSAGQASSAASKAGMASHFSVAVAVPVTDTSKDRVAPNPTEPEV